MTQRQDEVERETLPLVCILDGSVATTGALMAARREAALLADKARLVLLIPEDCSVADADLPEFERIIRLPIRPLRKRMDSAMLYLPGLARCGRALAKTLKALDCDRLQVNDFYLAQAAVARRFGFRGRIVTWVRIDPRNFGTAGRLWLAAARHASDAMVAVSSFIASRLGDEGVPVIYDPAPETAALNPRGQQFLFVGNYVEGKGQDIAIAAFHRIARDFPDARLQFHGSTMGLEKNARYRERLAALATDGPGAAQIRLKGFASELESAFRASFAAINCSNSESFSLTCLEASAHGLPVIATRCGGPEEIVADEATGFLIPVGDADALEQRMRRLLGDPALATRLGKAGRERVFMEFGADRFRGQVAALLDL